MCTDLQIIVLFVYSLFLACCTCVNLLRFWFLNYIYVSYMYRVLLSYTVNSISFSHVFVYNFPLKHQHYCLFPDGFSDVGFLLLEG